jgi:hypothetical protein
MNMFKGFDKYTIRARFLPAMFTVLPLAMVSITFGVHNPLGSGVMVWAIASCGGLLLVTQFVRDVGRRKEEKLFALWDGKSTTRMLQHRSTKNQAILSRRHKKLKALMKLSKLPSVSDEAQDAEAADKIYEACATYLREHTRNTKQFSLVFEENCNYGFRRNLWGLKPIGLTVSLLGLILGAGLFFQGWYAPDGHESVLYLFPTFANTLLFITWITGITPSWVRSAAEAYAERIMEASERL